MTKPATLSIPRDVAERFVREYGICGDVIVAHEAIEAVRAAIEAALRAEANAMDGFPEFWAVWPNRKAKRLAQLAWAKTATARPELHVLLAAVRANIASEAWRKDGGTFIPLPASWLNGHRWADELVSRAQVERIRTPEQLAEAQRIADEHFKRTRPVLYALREWSRKFGADNDREPTRDERLAKGLEIKKEYDGVRVGQAL